MKIVNSDDIYEKMLKDAGMTTTPEDIYTPKGQEIRGQAKTVTGRMRGNFLEGRLGIIIDGTGKDYDKIAKQVGGLRILDMKPTWYLSTLHLILHRNEI